MENPLEIQGLTLVDWSIIAVYIASTIFLGWYYGRRQTSTKEYFVGTGQMNPVLIGVSLFATLLSTISYLSMPGEALGKGPVYMMNALALPGVFLVVGFVLLPVYMNQRVTSAYELLEIKLGREIRTLGAIMFITLRLVWMSLLIYLTAKAMTIMLGVGEDRIPLIALVTGVVAVIYTSMGGLRAVVITDLLQTILLYGGALLVIGTVSWNLGGFSWIPTAWDPTWDTQPLFSTDLSVRVTLVGSVLNYLVWNICTAGGDQTSVQRFMATKDANAARRALATQLLVTVTVTVTLAFVGFALLGYFNHNRHLLPDDLDLKVNADRVFPLFIAYHLPPGISGLVVSAMFAAAMSSIDSGVNSITAVFVTDLLPLIRDTPPEVLPSGEDSARQRHEMNIARWLAFGIGALVVTASCGMGAIPGNITAVTTKTANLLATPIFGLFFFALFVPFASVRGVLIGTALGTLTAILIAFSGPITRLYAATFDVVLNQPDVDPISFQWIAPFALVVNIIGGIVASLLLPDRRSGARNPPA